MVALYIDSIQSFVETHPQQLLGALTGGLAEEGFDTSKPTTFSWQQEIEDLQSAFSLLLTLLPGSAQWTILLEYVLPIVGQRLDCVVLAEELIFVIEYKGGNSATARAALCVYDV